LLRVVLVNGVVTPDLKGNLPGRGARLHKECGFDAIQRKAFKWAFKLTESPDVSQFKKFLTELNAEQVSMIWPYIDSDIWQKKFADYPGDQEYAKEILTQAGW
jgi:predicted RNA-binding protein YlxR (DUF448 family)